MARKKEHRERDAVEETARAVEGLHTARDIDERESDRNRQRDNVYPASPWRHRADGGQRRADEVDRHHATQHIPQDRGGGAQDEHGVDEQQSAAAMDGPPLLRQQRYGTENNGEPACGNVDR